MYVMTWNESFATHVWQLHTSVRNENFEREEWDRGAEFLVGRNEPVREDK